MLTDTAIRNAKASDKPYKLSDFGGLYLFVTKTGTKLWRFNYRFNGRQKTISYGRHPDISLVDARKRHQEAKESIVAGVDPMEQKKVDASRSQTFEEVARRWIEAKSVKWAESYTLRVTKRLEDNIFPYMGKLPIASIEPPDLLKHIRRIEDRGVIFSARRISNYCGAIFRFGIAEGLCSRDPSADIRDALKSVPAVKHQTKLSSKELPRFLRHLDFHDVQKDTSDALKLVLFTVGRTDEIRFAHADEFEDLEGEAIWRISPERMKMSRSHLVPLSRQAVEVVRRRLDMNPQGLLFARNTRSGTISENTMLYAMYRMGFHGRGTVHGLRGVFSTVANENEWNSDWIELALAHGQDNQVRAAYNAAKYLKQRREMLQWWADYLDRKKEENLQD